MIGLDAVTAAALADDLLVQGETLQSVWRYAIVQLLDDYSHELARDGQLLLLDGSIGSPLRRGLPRSTPLWQI